MTLSIEILKKAREVGATHYLYCNGGVDIFIRHLCAYYRVLEDGTHQATLWESCDINEIDFTPLDDYQQDKALDIAATGIGE